MHFCFACVYSLIMWAGVSLGVFFCLVNRCCGDMIFVF